MKWEKITPETVLPVGVDLLLAESDPDGNLWYSTAYLSDELGLVVDAIEEHANLLYYSHYCIIEAPAK